MFGNYPPRKSAAIGSQPVELSRPDPYYEESAAPQRRHSRETPMAKITYRIVEHDGGWAYQVNGVFSETFPTRDRAKAAAQRAAAEQHVPGETRAISWEDSGGKWHEELARGDDRPETEVEG
jgi:Uncharacterized protein conserved in bacteria (DUF2188)